MAVELGRGGVAGAMSRRRTALIALHCLAAFARRQFDFLRKGLGPGGAFEIDERYPLAFLLEATARQMSFDIDVLLRSLSHREGASSSLTMRATLDLADRLAIDALAPAARHGLVEATALLTYFQKSPTIRLIPYAPLALIGIDFSTTGDRSRLLAIAHETGHHVYRQITVNYAAHLDEQIDALAAPAPETSAERWPQWLLAWEEEIFADIYAAIIGGPAAAFGLHQIILTGRRASLVEDDGDHPLDALRPQILHTTLRVMAEQGASAQRKSLLASADALNAAWQQHLIERGAPGEFIPAGEDAPVALADARSLLDTLIREMLDNVLAPLVADGNHTPWSTGAEDASSVFTESEAQFDVTCNTLAGKALPELSLRNNRRVVSVARFPVEGAGGERTIGQTGDPYLDELRSRGLAGESLEAEQWKAVFLGGDWTTQEGGSGIKPPVFSRRSFWWLPYRPAIQPVRRR
jgi:hypothetical protein